MQIIGGTEMTPEEYIKNKWGEEWLKFSWVAGDVVDALDDYGKQQWNAALDAAAENAEVEEKLGNPYDINSAYWEVDKKSIYKLKK